MYIRAHRISLQTENDLLQSHVDNCVQLLGGNHPAHHAHPP